MRYSTIINNIKANEWGLNIQQAYLFSWFYELPSWAEKVVIEGEIYYFASKNKAVDELPLLTEKLDTMYRYYKQIEEYNLIKIKKIDGKDYITLTEKAKEWNFNKSEYSEINPRLLGNKSENNSEINPTYNIYNTDNITSNNKHKSKTVFIPPTLEEVKLYFKENGYKEETGEKAFKYYEIGDWKDSKGNKVRNWKQKMQSVWFKEENKTQVATQQKMVY